MSDNSDAELPLPAEKDDDYNDSDSSSSSSSSSGSSAGSNEIPIPAEREPNQNGCSNKPVLDEIPIPEDNEIDRDHLELADTEIDIPLPPDSSKYSPSQVTPEDDMGISSSMESKKSGLTVLGKAQAKKRLLAFSAAKLAALSPTSAGGSTKKITPTKASILQKASSSRQEQQLAIETIKQEETKMKEILAMNSILNQKLKQVNAITHNIPIAPPITAIVKPTIITQTQAPVPSLLDLKVSPPAPAKVAKEEKIIRSPDRSRKASKQHIRKSSRSPTSSSHSHSRTSTSRSRSPSVEKRSSKRGRKSRSRSLDRKGKDKRDKETDRKEKKSNRKSRSRSKERGKHRKSHSRSRSKSKERELERRKKSRSRSKEREGDRYRRREKEVKKSRRSKSRSRERDYKEKRSTRRGSPDPEKEVGMDRDRPGRDRIGETDKLRSDRSRRDEEREKRAEEEKQLLEHQKELDKVRLNRMPVDWADFREHQFRHTDLRIVRKKLRGRSQSGSRSPTPGRGSASEEFFEGTPLSKGLTLDIKTTPIINSSGLTVAYPSFLVQKTKTKPSVPFGYSPLCSKGYYKTREQIFSEEDSEIIAEMKSIINSKTTTKDPPGITEVREWFAPTPQAFCPAAGKQAVVISHLYSDEEKDESPVPAPAPHKNNSSDKSSKKNRNTVPSPKVESMEEDEDSMDSAPSPLLKRKYEAPPSPPRPKKKSKRNLEPSGSEEEIPLRKDSIVVERETVKEKVSSSKSKKRDEDKEKKHEEGKDKRRDDVIKDKRRDHDDRDEHEDRDKRRSEKDKKREEKEKRREGKEKIRDEGEPRTLEKERKPDKKHRADREEAEIMKKDTEKHAKGEEVKSKKSKKHSEKDLDEAAPVKEKSSKSKEDAPEKTKEKKKKRDKEKKAKKKHKKRHESTSSESSRSPSPSSSPSSEESSKEESDHKSKSKRKKLKKKKKAKAKKDKSKTSGRDKSPDGSSDDKGGKDGGGASHSKGGGGGSSYRKDSYSRHDSRDRSRRDRSRERERDRRSSNYGRRRTADGLILDGEDFEDEGMASSMSESYVCSEMESDALLLMNPPNPLSDTQLQLLDAEIDSILDSSSKQTSLTLEPEEKATQELLSAFDEDELLQSVLQNENISAEKLLMNIPASDFEGEDRSASLAAKPVVSWSDDSEEELKRVAEKPELQSRTPPPPVTTDDPITPVSQPSTSGYETEIKTAATDGSISEHSQHSEKSTSDKGDKGKESRDRERERERDSKRDRDNRRDYYDRSRLLQAHVYDRRGGRRGGFHYDRYNRERDYRSDDRYYQSRSSGSSHSHRYRDDRDRRSSRSPDDRDRDRRRRRYDDDIKDRYIGRSDKLKEFDSQGREVVSVKTESPPVPDSTISDSELQSGNNTGNAGQIANTNVGTNEGASAEYRDPSFYYNHATTEPGSEGQQLSGEFTDDNGQGSPKRLSLDERLEIEMGLEKSQFLPVPRSEVPTPQITIHHMNRIHSQINLLGKLIQIVPIDIPPAPIVIRSTYPVGTQFDVYGNPICDPFQPGQYPPRRIITIKVPIVPFAVPVMDPEALQAKEPKIRRKKGSKHEKQKRKPTKLELERAKRKKGAEAKLLRKSKHRREKESHDKQVAKETKAEAGESSLKKVKPEPEETTEVKELVDDVKDAVETITQEPEVVPEGGVASSPSVAALAQGDGGVTVKQEPQEEGSEPQNEKPATESEVKEIVEPEQAPPPKKIEILPAPDRGILLMYGFRDKTTEERKKVKFADGIDPGCGTSSSGGEELASPPPSYGKDPILEAQLKRKMKIKRKKKKKKLLAEQTDLFSPPECPKMAYPFCPPGILYQVCPQYAVVYAQAMAEKGLDIIFEPTTEVPQGSEKQDFPEPIVQPLIASLSQKPLPEMPLSTPPAQLPAGIDFSRPPPSTYGGQPPDYDYTNAPPTNYAAYEITPPPRHKHDHDHHRSYSHSDRRSDYRGGRGRSSSDSYYTPPQPHTPPETFSKIPTIVNHQPRSHQGPETKTISPVSLKPPGSYRKESRFDRDTSTSGQSIQVVSRGTPTATPTYPMHEEQLHYNHTYSTPEPPMISPHFEHMNHTYSTPEPPMISPHFEHMNHSYNPPVPLLISPQLADVPPLRDFQSSNILVPVREEQSPRVTPRQEAPVKKTSKKETNKRESSKSGSKDIGISIPLSKIISKSSIPSLAHNSANFSQSRIPNLTPAPLNQYTSPRNSYSGVNNLYHPNYTQFDFTPYNSTPASNLISVKPKPILIPKPNLYEVPITKTLPAETTAEPEPAATEQRPDVNNITIPTSAPSTPTPTLISPVNNSIDTGILSSPASAFSGNYYNKDLLNHNLDNKFMIASTELVTFEASSNVSNFGHATEKVRITGDGDETPPPPGTSPC